MTSPSINTIFYSLLGLAVAYPLIGVHGWRAAARLLTSRRVVVREYRTVDLTPEAMLTEATLPRSAVLRLAFLFILPRGIPLHNKCIFAPHHEIEITDARGVVRRIIICFGCDYLLTTRSSTSTDWRSQNGPLHSLGSRAKTLKHWMQTHGIPVRPETYVWSQSPSGM